MTERIYATGKRKTSIARVWLEPGEGKVLVNEREFKNYFPRETADLVAMQPFDLTETRNQFNVLVTVKGGGPTGQAEAIRHGIAKALLQVSPDYKDKLKKAGLLTRDSRVKERKKYGKRSARASFQFSKR